MAAWGRVLPDQGRAAAQPCRIKGMWEDAAGPGAVWQSSGAPGPAAASLECRVMPAWVPVGRELRGNNAGYCHRRSHKGVSWGAARHGRPRLRGAAGQSAAISGNKVLPVPGAGCCRPEAQRAVRRAQRSRRDRALQRPTKGDALAARRQPGPGTGMPGAGRGSRSAGPTRSPESGRQGALGQRRCPQMPGAGVEPGSSGAVPGS